MSREDIIEDINMRISILVGDKTTSGLEEYIKISQTIAQLVLAREAIRNNGKN